jgi:hypothetical protein
MMGTVLRKQWSQRFWRQGAVVGVLRPADGKPCPSPNFALAGVGINNLGAGVGVLNQ